MYAGRFNLVLAAFFLLSLFVFISSYQVGHNLEQAGSAELSVKTRAESYSKFALVDYFISNDKGLPSLYLNANELKIDNHTNDTAFTDPQGRVYSQDGVPVFYQALSGKYSEEAGILTFNGKVRLDYLKSRLDSDSIKYFENAGRIDAFGLVKTVSENEKNGDQMFIDSDQLSCWPDKKISLYKGSVVGKIARKKVYEPEILFWTDKLRTDLNSSIAKLSGNVKLKKQGFTGRSRTAEIFLDNYNKKLKYYVLYDDVKIEEKIVQDKESFIRKAFGEKLEVFNLDRKLVLTGAPKVYQGKDVIRGNVIVLRENIETVEVDDSSSIISIK